MPKFAAADPGVMTAPALLRPRLVNCPISSIANRVATDRRMAGHFFDSVIIEAMLREAIIVFHTSALYR